MALGGWTLGRAAPAQVLGRDGTQAAAESSLYGGSLGRVVWFGEQRYSSTYTRMSCDQLTALFNEWTRKAEQAEGVLKDPAATTLQLDDMREQLDESKVAQKGILAEMCRKKCPGLTASYCAEQGNSWG